MIAFLAAVTIALPGINPPFAPDSVAQVSVAWTAPSEDGPIGGPVASYDLAWGSDLFRLPLTPKPPGNTETYPWTIARTDTARVYSTDDAGNVSAPSNRITLAPGSGAASHYRGLWHDVDGSIYAKTVWATAAGYDESLPRNGALIPTPGVAQTGYLVWGESRDWEGYLEVALVDSAGIIHAPQYMGHMRTFAEPDAWWAAEWPDHPLQARLMRPEPFPGRTWLWSRVTQLPYSMRAATVWSDADVQAHFCPRWNEIAAALGLVPCP
jgi:hypothetical protein